MSAAELRPDLSSLLVSMALQLYMLDSSLTRTKLQSEVLAVVCMQRRDILLHCLKSKHAKIPVLTQILTTLTLHSIVRCTPCCDQVCLYALLLAREQAKPHLLVVIFSFCAIFQLLCSVFVNCKACFVQKLKRAAQGSVALAAY